MNTIIYIHFRELWYMYVFVHNLTTGEIINSMLTYFPLFRTYNDAIRYKVHCDWSIILSIDFPMTSILTIITIYNAYKQNRITKTFSKRTSVTMYLCIISLWVAFFKDIQISSYQPNYTNSMCFSRFVYKVWS